MHPDRGPASPVTVLLVGSTAWRSHVGPVVEQVDGLDTTPVSTTAAARDRLGGDTPPDIVVSAQQLDDGTGRDLAETTQMGENPRPFVLAPETAESVEAADCTPATWVVPMDETGPGTVGEAGLATVLERERDHARERRRGARFQAVADDPDRFVAVLARDGTIQSLNATADDALGGEGDRYTGKRFWALPWRDGQLTKREAQQAVQDAREGDLSRFEAVLSTATGEQERLEFRVRPTDAGDLLVQGDVLAERAQLEAELQASEELHRVTLNNMTDTVLVTNDAGEFTYVCPNVHFIFGYTAEEIYDLGTIDALLGADLFDERRLESETVITNIECTAPDKAGDEHTLLVNVRNVSIQEGTRLYSCRDITTRKQREQALTQLHETSRELLYAETTTAVANQVARDATTALTNGGVALYRLDDAENTLYPLAASQPIWDHLGSLPDVTLDQRHPISRAYLEGTTTRPAATPDPADSDRRAGVLANLTGYTVVPLGEHGVLLVGAVEEAGLDGVDEEVGELLAATTEAAFDRLAREAALRERDEALQEQNDRLSEVNQVNEIIRDIDSALVAAETREEIERAVVEQLTAEGRFAFAWIAESTARNRRLRPREWAATGAGYLDSVSLSVDGDDTAPEPAAQALRDGALTVVPNVADRLHEAAWCKEAVSRNFDSVLSIPLVYDGVSFGTLTVYDDEPYSFGETVQSVFAEFGTTIGAAINSIQRKEALRSDSVFRLEHEIRDPASVLLRLAERFDCILTVESEVSRSDETTLVFVTVEGASPQAVVEEAASYVDVTAAECIRDGEDEGLVSFAVRGQFVTALLASHGATRRRLVATPRAVQLVVDVPDTATIRAVDEMLSQRFASVDLVSQRKEPRPIETDDRDDAGLTDRQREVAQVAYHCGFFDADRDVTGRDVADRLGISHTAFYDHINRIERKLFAGLVDRDRPQPAVE
ncbi:bacterio-opsin activator domain-containing protein [Haloarchaeobius amylolyticus]|uniref:bacterio-opsin activator domain-containing protein n=1 Tax=Haloarchaeobius amylolyticus TaxID=1198296 RepID=UPI00226E6668|nr:bacterio-opsin activator domain-containing protein [Haloarchaeobius amylolyticus]